MSISQAHNLAHALPRPEDCRYGIRVKLRASDPFGNLVGADWHKEHWYATAQERDAALVEMSEKYIYFRAGDAPTLDFEILQKP